MTDNSRLPRRTNNQKLGESAQDIFSSTFIHFCNVVPVPQSRDLGIDFFCEVMEGDYPTGLMFNAQCKNKEQACEMNRSLSIQIKIKTINYWLSQRNPTFLFVYDYQNKDFLWCFPLIHLLSLSKEWRFNDSISLPMPSSNRFSRDIVQIPSDLLEIIQSEDLRRKLDNLQEYMHDIRQQYEAELDYQTQGAYKEYWAELELDE
ncbi:DUF4365 domain-containing protein [Synechocystis sp. LKSZ1]|uniref:DUF4365 domain-containing protein n=1 Tax=Synechocystis sp. LKSZ1 TaxID=3144951 RepID=UPI00336C11F4